MYHTVSFPKLIVPFIIKNTFNLCLSDLLLKFHHFLSFRKLNFCVRVHADHLSALLHARQAQPIICFVQLVFSLKLDLLVRFLLDHSYIPVRHAGHCVVNLCFFLLMPAQPYRRGFTRVDQYREERITAAIFILIISTNCREDIDNLIILSRYIYTASRLGEWRFVDRNIICFINIFLPRQVKGLRRVLFHHIFSQVAL